MSFYEDLSATFLSSLGLRNAAGSTIYAFLVDLKSVTDEKAAISVLKDTLQPYRVERIVGKNDTGLYVVFDDPHEALVHYKNNVKLQHQNFGLTIANNDMQLRFMRERRESEVDTCLKYLDEAKRGGYVITEQFYDAVFQQLLDVRLSYCDR